MTVTRSGWIVNGVLAVFIAYFIAYWPRSGAILGLNSSPLWEPLLILAGVLFASGLGMGASGLVVYRCTGVVYARDRVRFARMGGFDIGRVPMLTAQMAVYCVFLVTARFRPDVLGGARTPSIYLLASTLAGLMAVVLIAWHHFRPGADSLAARAESARPRAQSSGRAQAGVTSRTRPRRPRLSR